MPTHRKTKPEQNNSLKDFDLPIWWVEQVLKQKQHLRKLKFNDTDELIPLEIWKNLTIWTNPRKPNVRGIHAIWCQSLQLSQLQAK